MKICTSCGVPQEEIFFGKKSANNDGLCYMCKDCTRIYNHKRYLKNRDEILDRSSKYNREHKDTIKKPSKEKAYKAYKKWYLANKEKKSAHAKLAYAVKHGKLLKQSCSVCKDPKSEAHHVDYSKPLEVIWLCKKHHGELHTKRGSNA